MSAADDLRERLKRVTKHFTLMPASALQLTHDEKEAAIATLRAVLAEPHLLMGEPVKWMDVDGDTVSAEYYAGADDRTKEWYKIPLYAPPEVKP